jgi:hypothetical protein
MIPLYEGRIAKQNGLSSGRIDPALCRDALVCTRQLPSQQHRYLIIKNQDCTTFTADAP